MRLSVSELRANLADVINRVAYGKECVTIERQGKELAVLVPMEVFRLLEAADRAEGAKPRRQHRSQT